MAPVDDTQAADLAQDIEEMMKRAAGPIVKDLVLLGGGHSHVSVLRQFGMRPLPGVRLTLIARDVHTPYSGMLPGLIAGHYTRDEAHIDLRPLAQFAACDLYHDEVIGLDLRNNRVLCRTRPPVAFDLLSINIGSTPNLADVPGAARYTVPVKPVDRLLAAWEELVEQAPASRGPVRVAVVGGGAGGVELSLCMQYRLRALLAGDAERLEFHLVTDCPELLPTHNPRVRDKFERILRARGVHVHKGHKVVEVTEGLLTCESGATVPFERAIWVTHAAAPAWLREAGLKTDANGFVLVNDALQSLSHPAVFAAGDVAAIEPHPRPKSGVFAVREGPPLAANLRRSLLGRALKVFTPQHLFLGLISTGDRYAIASRGGWALEGRLVWRWKDWIDRRFMRRYSELPEPPPQEEVSLERGLAGPDAIKEISSLAMRCGGCGAKVGSTILARVLARLDPVRRDDVLIGLDAPDDAAVVQVPAGRVMVHTVDYFRSFIDDPYVFGQVAANHSLGDIFAMGAVPQSALAIATVPYGVEAKVEEQLYQLMAGALKVLNACNTALVGGHTGEGMELAFGCAVNGLADPGGLLRKGGMQPGDRLLLTKPLGTGTLFAADMRRKARGRWIEAAIEAMLQSNREAAQCLLRHGATACTDVTGFGLLGHLVEMTRPSRVDAELDLDSLPVIEGAMETLAMGIFSSLQPQNLRLRRAVRDLERSAHHRRYPLLFDPQTAGGLLATVPEEQAQPCLAELEQLGYRHATFIGRVLSRGGDMEPIVLRAP
jgi:selenide, water dikinase